MVNKGTCVCLFYWASSTLSKAQAWPSLVEIPLWRGTELTKTWRWRVERLQSRPVLGSPMALPQPGRVFFRLWASGENSVHQIGSLTPMSMIKLLQYLRSLRHGKSVFSKHFLCWEITNFKTGVFTTISVMLLKFVTWSQLPSNTGYFLCFGLTETWLQESIWYVPTSWLMPTRWSELIAFPRNPGFFYQRMWLSNSWSPAFTLSSKTKLKLRYFEVITQCSRLHIGNIVCHLLI